MQAKNQIVLYGRHAVFSALKNPKRKVLKILVAPENEAEFKREFQNLPYQIASKKEIEKLAGQNAVHQGYVLLTYPLEQMFLEDLIEKTADKQRCHVLILDQVTDPQNIGAIIRSAAAFGTTAIIVQDKNAPLESGAMAKASAGTLEFMPIVRVTNLSRAIEALKKAGFWIVGMDGYAKQKLEDVDKNAKLAVVMGSEGSGMRRLIEESCDIKVRLAMDERVESLNVSVAAGIVLYELNKKLV
ncbi:MAG TPA: 23S rRNA (guanosine(2251)-2'-O)-methyltransferase RlmB [Alphaproteobacteria bacterium]|nr:23S rRNA (guanosine(2251)-2'-O)-methyltransferase RlmB [Alphaproteobacteria bacterium]